jgi:hypothetical protein
LYVPAGKQTWQWKASLGLIGHITHVLYYLLPLPFLIIFVCTILQPKDGHGSLLDANGLIGGVASADIV